MLQSPLGAEQQISSPLGVSAGGEDWWLDALLAFQPMGASSYATSKVDLTGNGYNLIDGALFPTWTPADGWAWDGTTNKYLLTPVLPSISQAQMTIAIRYTNTTNGYVLVGYVGNESYDAPNIGGGFLYFQRNNKSFFLPGGGSSAGIYAVSADKAYINGTLKGTLGAGTFGSNTRFVFGINQLLTGNRWNGKMQAFALFNRALSPTEITTITANMQAL